MKELKEQIETILRELENMVAKEENKNKITKQRKKLDDLLKKYLKDI